MIKICLIYEFLSEQGGLERELINHANFLKKEGYDVELLTCSIDKEIFNLLPFENIKVSSISKINTPSETLNILLCLLGFNNLNKYNPDLFISYSFLSNYLIRNKKAKRVNYVNHHPHFLYLEGKDKLEWASSTQGFKRWVSVAISLFLGKFLKNADKKLMKKNDFNFANSKFTKKRIDKIYNINSKVSYPPLDSKFKVVKTTIKDDYIFSSSRIIPDKKYEWLIEALSYMKNKIPLYIAGSVDKKYKKKLLALAKKFKVNVKFLGKLNTKEIRSYYSSAKVFAFPTPEEDFGLVPAESLACGTPVVAWDDGAGPTEQIKHNLNGFLAKPYDLKDYAKKIDKCIDVKLKSKNKKRILKSSNKFSVTEVRNDFVKSINKLMK